MPPKKKKKMIELTMELEAGNAAMVDLGKMLGPTGVNTRGVKQEYDEATAGQRGDIVPVVVTVYEDRSHELRYKTPPTSFLIRKAINAKGGSTKPGHDTSGQLSQDQIREIAQRKMTDMNSPSIEAAMKSIAGSARSMGVKVAE